MEKERQIKKDGKREKHMVGGREKRQSKSVIKRLRYLNILCLCEYISKLINLFETYGRHVSYNIKILSKQILKVAQIYLFLYYLL